MPPVSARGVVNPQEQWEFLSQRVQIASQEHFSIQLCLQEGGKGGEIAQWIHQYFEELGQLHHSIGQRHKLCENMAGFEVRQWQDLERNVQRALIALEKKMKDHPLTKEHQEDLEWVMIPETSKR